ncbi:tetratricopeptide repeat protein [Crocosphaera sp. UHCC 0190]|uniref:tetratricopeptide repeat protein n=1 Tax=Crocosphaera sp. UHCC 0190 TaxID=3110246 RepID=UPI002B203E73|nr:tetratricopeptide repeat protein [Crocosphaera sp. UHCC 0190]
MMRLEEDLKRGDMVAISAVAGVGGIGKTELASQYANKYQNNYPGGIIWLSEGVNDISLEVLQFFQVELKLDVPFKDYQDRPLSVKQQINYCWQHYPFDGLVLVVFDDITNIENLLESIPEDKRFRLLVTTRLRNLDPNYFQTIPLDILSDTEALELLTKLLGDKDKRTQKEPENAAKLCEWLEYLPLGIQLIGGYLRNDPDLSLVSLLSQLETKGLEDASLQEKSEYKIKKVFAFTWEKLNPITQQVGMFLSLFSPKEIVWEVVEYVAIGEDLAENRTPLNLSTDELNEGKKELYSYHLLQRDDTDEYYKIHALVRLFLQEKLVESAAFSLMNTFSQNLIAIFQNINQSPTLEQIDFYRFFILHLEELGNYLSETIPNSPSSSFEQFKVQLQQSVTDKQIIRVFISLSRFFNGQGLYLSAEPWSKKCLEVVIKRLGDNHPDVPTSLNNLAALYDSQGRYEDAEPLYLQALELSQRLLGDNHLDVATYLNNLAALYKSQGRYEDAEPLYLQALELKKRLLGDNYPNVATYLNNLAALYDSQGRYEDAEPLYLQALELRKRLLGDNHPDVASSLNNLAGLYNSQGRYEDAEPLYLQALELRKRLLGDNHPDVASSLNNLAELYRSQGRYEDAEPLYLQALELKKRLLGDNHPHVATSLNNLAELYRSQGRYEDAEPLYLQALELWKRLLGDNHPHVAYSLNNLALLYKSQGRYEDAEPLYLQALELSKRLLGDNHPDVATSLNNLAELYRSQGRYEDAEPLYLQALELKKRLLGDNHPDVATSLNNLAALYDSQGRYEEAEPLFLQALELWKRLLGDNHPYVATSLNNLAALYKFQGRYEEAEPLFLQALELWKRLLGDNHPDVATSLNNLAALYDSQGRYEEAEPLYLQAINISRERLGENHPNTQTFHQNYRIMLSQRRNPWKRLLLGLIQGVLRLLILPFYYVWLGLRWLVRRLRH